VVRAGWFININLMFVSWRNPSPLHYWWGILGVALKNMLVFLFYQQGSSWF
jgi:hypothetical protein